VAVKTRFLGSGELMRDAHLVLLFDDRDRLDAAAFERVRHDHPAAHIVGCSTAGAIADDKLCDELVGIAVQFDATRVELARVTVSHADDSDAAGVALAAALTRPDLVHVLVISDGLAVNGTALVEGLLRGLPAGVTISGGLAAYRKAVRTTVIADAPPAAGLIAAVGLYGASLRVGCGSLGGWDPFGPERQVTHAHGQVLFELDHRPALELYRQYLGEHAAGLPATGLLFPLSVRPAGGGPAVVRTILSVDEASGSITFAGDMPVGHVARLMKANFDRLIDGAHGAAQISADRLGKPAELALLVSCAGRRMVLQQRTEEELEAVREVIGAAPMIGFYSLGELSPSGVVGCELHNQTMTITTFAER
jgi:hypothetical protein